MSLLNTHIIPYTDMSGGNDSTPASDLVLAKVAGYDTACYGLPPASGGGVKPLLFQYAYENVRLLVSTTQLSNFARCVRADLLDRGMGVGVWELHSGECTTCLAVACQHVG